MSKAIESRIQEAAKSKFKAVTGKQGTNGIKKQYVKSKKICKVTFRLPKAAVRNASTAAVTGDFNSWDRMAAPMKLLKNGEFTATLELDIGREYRFRYLIDDNIWENDWHADKYVPNSFGSDDSVVIV